MAEPGLEGLLDRLRRQTTSQSSLNSTNPMSQQGNMISQPSLDSIHQQQQHQHQHQQQHQQQQQKQYQQQQPQQHHNQAFHQQYEQQAQPQFHTDSLVYSPLRQPQVSNALGFGDHNGFPGFHPPSQNPQASETTQQQQHSIPTTQSPVPTQSQHQPPYSLPMSPSHRNPLESQTDSLLRLLKFSQGPPDQSNSQLQQQQLPPLQQTVNTPVRPYINSPPPPPPISTAAAAAAQGLPPHNRAISASDLVASFFGRQQGDSTNASRENSIHSARTSPVLQRTASESVPNREKSPVNPQDLVFQLLGGRKPVQQDHTAHLSQTTQGEAVASNTQVSDFMAQESSMASDQREKEEEKSSSATDSLSAILPLPPIRSASAAPQSRSSPVTPGDGPTNNGSQTPSKGLFTYVNPFESLHATSPRNKTPKSSTPVPGSVPAGRKSGLGTNEIRAENIALPFTPSPVMSPIPHSPPTQIEAEASKDAASLDQVRRTEKMLMEQLDQQVAEADQYPFPEPTSAIPEMYKDLSNSAAPVQSDIPKEDFASDAQPETNGQMDVSLNTVAADVDHDEYRDTFEIEVYNFPMKPFSSISIVPTAIKPPNYPTNKISDIARMSRTFDQLDRNLISASNDYIVYAMSKSGGRGGIRVIRQYDAKDKVLFKDSPDRTFNVTIGKSERVLGTGISGAVSWVDLAEDFESGNWGSMFVFPPSEEQGQSNGVLKSRARRTSRMKDVFAIGRGKTISIIHAPIAKYFAKGRKGDEVDSKRYLAEHTRTIDTGKASKDFAFSDDDSVIISIDKAGKLKFWDVQELLNFSENDGYDLVKKEYLSQPPMVLSNPALCYSAVAAGESYRATSVLFLDKFRPYMKCLALRYAIVGMKQNHTLQLWDLALGRPVQEINFPQESDTDALCSVAYHAPSGIIVVGNPTRNSIYFIHLSAPKYNLPTLSQAEYIRGLAEKSPIIPKPEATAILSGLREYSFASTGKLMSLDILDTDGDNGDSMSLFELYVAHSKGMTTLAVYREELGWDHDNKVANPVDAIERGVCTISSLPAPPPPEKDEPKSDSPETSAQNLKPKSERSSKSRSVSPAARKSDTGDAAGAGKKKKKDRNVSTPQPSLAIVDAPAPFNGKVERTIFHDKGKALQTSEGETTVAVPQGFLDREVKRIESTVSAEFNKVIGKELEILYRKLDEDRRVQSAASDAKQEAILRLLSSTLTENVEQVISRIVMSNIETLVVPAISDVTQNSVQNQLQQALGQAVNHSLPNELRRIIPDAVGHAMQQQDLLKRISDTVTRPLTQAVEREFSHSLHTSLIPAFQKMAIEIAQKSVQAMETKHKDTIAYLEDARKQDAVKIDQLLATVTSLSDNISTMAKAQQDFQDQVRQAQEEYYGGNNQPPTVEPTGIPAPLQKTPEQLEAEEIENLLKSGKYEDGTIKWLQSKERQAELFDEVMVRYRYDFLPNLSQLVLLSVSAAVSVKFDHKVLERLSWLEGVLAVLDPLDPEIHEICQRIMVVVVQRLEQLYMSVAEVNPQNPVTRKIPSIARRARDLISLSARN